MNNGSRPDIWNLRTKVGEQTASDGGDQRRRVLCLSRHWHCPLRTSPVNARVSPSHRTRRRLQISRRTTSSLAPGTVRTDRAEREIAGGAVRKTSRQARVWRQVVEFRGIGVSAVTEVVQPGGAAEGHQLVWLHSRLGSQVCSHTCARAFGDPTWLGASG